MSKVFFKICLVNIGQSGYRLLWKVQQYVARFIGTQWPALAQECAFKRKDIKRIKAQYPNSLQDQIHQMFSEMEIYGKCNAHSLMQCLRSAAYKSTHADSVLRNLAEYVFNCVVAGEYVWHSFKLPKYVHNFLVQQGRLIYRISNWLCYVLCTVFSAYVLQV